MSTRLLVVGAGLGALMAAGYVPSAEAKPAAADQSSKEMSQELKALREQVEALQRRLDAQAGADQQTKAQADSAAAQAASAKAEAAALPAQIHAEVQTAVAAAKPKTDKIYYKGVTLTLGGFSALESIYRSHGTTADISTSFGAIPYANGAVGHTSEFRFTARQSRLAVLAQGDVSPQTHLGFYGEFDFQAAAQTGNSNESNSYSPRIRHLYGSVDWDDSGLHMLAGQNWSLVTLNSKGITPRNEVAPPSIDAQYVPGFTWARQPQLRLTKDFDKQLWLAVSLENPQTTFYTGANPFPSTVHVNYNSPAGSGFNSANTLSLNHVPDVVAKLAYETEIAERSVHVEVYGLYRNFYERLNYSNQSASGGGFGGGLTIPLIPKVLDFQVSGLGGKGIGRYGTSQLADVTFDGAGNIRPIHEIAALAGLTLHASPKLDLYLFAGEEKASAQPYNLTSGAGVITPYGYGNALYSNSGCVSETATGGCVGNTRLIEQATVGFWHKPYAGNYGKFQWGLQYSYTERKAFSGSGALDIVPIANDSMVFASIRYYPF
ncbi:MAG: hypothetical protein ABJC66_09865 [Gammaproteobacteria bacterium]